MAPLEWIQFSEFIHVPHRQSCINTDEESIALRLFHNIATVLKTILIFKTTNCLDLYINKQTNFTAVLVGFRGSRVKYVRSIGHI